jgi:hypothetical protein
MGTSTDGDRWVQADRLPPRHRCEDHLPDPVPDRVDVKDKWICGCGRRWRLMWKPSGLPIVEFAPHFAEGVTITGPDGAVYWRTFRCRFIGWIGT